MPKQGSTSDPGARIFTQALTSCLKQTASMSSLSCPSNGLRHSESQRKPVLANTGCLKQTAGISDPVNPCNGLIHDDSQKPLLAVTVNNVNQAGSLNERVVYPTNGLAPNDLRSKLVLGSNRRISSTLNSANVSEVFQNEVNHLGDYDKVVKRDSADKMYDARQKENFAVLSLVKHSKMETVGQFSGQDSSRCQPKRQMKSVISVINNHLSRDSDCNGRKPALKRSASDCLNDNSEAENSQRNNPSRRTVFMSERGSDTALLVTTPKERFSPLQSTPDYTSPRSDQESVQSESKDMSEAHLSPSDSSANSGRMTVFTSTKFESYTPVSRLSYGKSDKWHHQRSTYPEHKKRSAADITPFSPLTRSSESSPVRRIKRARTVAFIPSYDLKSINLKPSIRVIDSHCHLDFLFTRENYHNSYSSYRSERSETFPDCYEGCITIFCEPQSFFRKSEWDSVLQEDGVWAAFGCHPHMASRYNDEAEDALVTSLNDPKVIALGEIGLDYSRRNNCDRDLQKQVLRRQLKIGLDHNRPLIIHCRDAHDDCLEIVKELVPREHSIHLHCFTDTWQRAQEWLSEFPNLYIGITNLVTFPTAEDVHEIARNIPVDRLLLETDTPYFVPKSLSLRWSHPGLVIHAAAQITAFKEDIQLEDLLRTVRNNTHKMYGI